MCIIIVKPENEKLPAKSIIENCFDSNPDGAGFMYADNGQVHISKGFMKLKTFYQALGNIDLSLPMVLHFRIATAGGISQHNCHPFPLSNDVHSLKALNIDSDIGIAHNGIINIKEETKLSDTQTYIKNILYPLRDQIDLEPFQNMISLSANSSKFAIMKNSGSIILLGDFTKDNGIYYSNSSYKEQSFKSYYKTLWDYDKDYCYGNYLPEHCPFCYSKDIQKSNYDLICKECGEVWAGEEMLYRDI